MATWVVALALSAGYLVNRKMALGAQVEKLADEHHKPLVESTDGVSSKEIRAVNRDLRYVDNDDYDMRLPKEEVRALKAKQQAARAEVQQFDGAAQIQGVFLQQFV